MRWARPLEKQSEYLGCSLCRVLLIPVVNRCQASNLTALFYIPEWFRPFVIDLESSNGTFVNGAQIPPTRYYELKLSDVLKFGASTREFVLLHEGAEEDES